MSPEVDSWQDAVEEAVEIEGYAEVRASWLETGGGSPFIGDADLQRFVLELEHGFGTSAFDMEVELEWEHALACAGCSGLVEVEEGYLGWEPANRMELQAGLVLVPFGQVNLRHAPGEYYGTDRPRVDQLVVPTTWRELGVSFQTRGDVRVSLALTTAPDPTAMGRDGLLPTLGMGSHVRANAPAGTARLEVEPMDDTVLAASLYGANLGPNGDFYDAAGERLNLLLPLGGAEIDLRSRFSAFDLRAEAAGFAFPEAEVLLAARREDGSPYFTDDAVVPTSWYGAYVEGAVDVLHWVPSAGEQEAHVFGRAEAYDTTAGVPDGRERDPSRQVVEWTTGLAWHPIRPIVVTADLALRDRKLGLDERQLDLGLSWSY